METEKNLENPLIVTENLQKNTGRPPKIRSKNAERILEGFSESAEDLEKSTRRKLGAFRAVL